MRNYILLLSPFLLIFIFYAEISHAQKSVQGQVLEASSQQPLTGVLIYTNDGVSDVSNTQGYFEITPTENSEYIIASYLSYRPDTVHISTIDSSLTFEMDELSTSLEEIIVRSNLTSYKEGFVGSNYRLSPTKVANRNALETGELIRTIPGVNMVGDMGLGNRPNISIRGSWGRRSKKILLLEDGSPAAPAPYVAPGAYYNAVSDRVQSVEVYKGADMLRYGPNNMFGAVNFITATPPQKPQARVRLVGGQRNYMTGLMSYGGTWNKLGVLVEGVYKRFNGFRQNSSVEMFNLNAKIFAELNDQQSLYFKVGGQIEDNQASLSSITPFTFGIDPLQNPFDADQFTMQRLGLDVIHKYVSDEGITVKSKLYSSSFERDWWRQVTDLVQADQLRSYVGEDIFNNRYGYLENQPADSNDYVRVGRVVDGRESTTDNRWAFNVVGLKETINFDWEAGDYTHKGELGFNTHFETFSDKLLRADSSRWARSGRIDRDLYYQVWATNAYARFAFHIGNFTLVPIYRLERVSMFRQDRKAAAQNPNLTESGGPKEQNTYWVSQPGLSFNYDFGSSEVYGSLYRGFIAPSKVFGFLVERNGIIVNPLEGESINIEPELSVNAEIGWKGDLIPNILNGQITGFQTRIENFYAAGRNEVFEKRGTIRTRGIEVALGLPVVKKKNHYLNVELNATFLQSEIQGGTLVDRDLFSQIIHNPATIQEFSEKYEAAPGAYNLFINNEVGDPVLWFEPGFPIDQFEDIDRVEFNFDSGQLEDYELPYTPQVNLTVGFTYEFKGFSFGGLMHRVGEQYTSFANFDAESSDGAIGKLDAFTTVDAYINYNWKLKAGPQVQVFLNGKNIGNQVFRASRLNRFTSGIFPGGFRQIIAGVNLTW